MKVNEITEAAIGAAIEVHRALGLGLLESAYIQCLWIPEYEAKRYEGRVTTGGVLLSVHCDASEHQWLLLF